MIVKQSMLKILTRCVIVDVKLSSANFCAPFKEFSQALTSSRDSNLIFFVPNSIGPSRIFDPLVHTVSKDCSIRTHICCSLKVHGLLSSKYRDKSRCVIHTFACFPGWLDRHQKPFGTVSNVVRRNF